MKKFFKCNPQLKEVKITSGSHFSSNDDNIFSAIGEHLPLVEKVWIDCICQPPSNRNAFASLKKLKISGDCCLYESSRVSLAINILAAAKVPLQFLHLECEVDHQLVAAISQIKTITTLILPVCIDLQISQWLSICQNLTELTELGIGFCRHFNSDGLVKIIQIANKLQRINLGRNDIDQLGNSATCRAIVKILQRRAMKLPLEIYIAGGEERSLEYKNHELLHFFEDKSDMSEDIFDGFFK